MSTLSYKCPSCGAPLTYAGAQQEMSCGSCGNSFAPETVRQVNNIEQEDAQAAARGTNWDFQEQVFTGEDAEQTRTYSCSSCGAELLTEVTTVATNCAFCGSPSIIPAQFTPGTRPEIIIPFTVSKAEAEAKFFGYFKGRKMIPNYFLQDKNRIEEIRQLYVPYWLFSCVADGRMSFNATRVSSYVSGKYRVTVTDHYLVRREGSLAFRDLPIDANSQVDNAITETLEPYHADQAIPFSPETLSGAMANRADVSAEDCKQRADARIATTMESVLRGTVQGYHSVSTRSRNIVVDDGKAVPALYPIWFITTKRQGKIFTFAINGQTGELTCNIPYSKGKFLGWTVGVAAGATAALFAIGTILATLGVFS